MQMANRPHLYHGVIPKEEFIMKDGQTYYPFQSLLRHIEEDVKYHNHKKWGFLIYHCDYTSDEAWAKFLSNLNWRIKRPEMLKVEDLRDTMEMMPKEDKEVLDGARVDQVRTIFTGWVRSDEAGGEINDGPRSAFICPRHIFCVYVDAGVLSSVVNRAPQPPTQDQRQISYVNLVKLRLKGFAQEFGIPMEDFMDNDEYEEDDESEHGDENFVRVPLSYLGPEHYNELYCWSNFERWVQYQRGDGVS